MYDLLSQIVEFTLKIKLICLLNDSIHRWDCVALDDVLINEWYVLKDVEGEGRVFITQQTKNLNLF